MQTGPSCTTSYKIGASFVAMIKKKNFQNLLPFFPQNLLSEVLNTKPIRYLGVPDLVSFDKGSNNRISVPSHYH